MSIIFSIKKSRETLNEEWWYLIMRGKQNVENARTKIFLGLLTISLLYMAMYFFSPHKNYITLKVVLLATIALAWCAFIISYGLHVWGIAMGKRKLKHFVKHIDDNQLNYSVQIDDEAINITSIGSAYAISWSAVQSYGIHNDTIYVFNQKNEINALYWNKTEMGDGQYLGLQELLQTKTINRSF